MPNWITLESDHADFDHIARDVAIKGQSRVATYWEENGERMVFRLTLTRVSRAGGWDIDLDGKLHAGLIGPVVANVFTTIEDSSQWQDLQSKADELLAQARRIAVVG